MQELTHVERETLQNLLKEMIPACAIYNVPGADDADIFEDILASMKRETDNVREALHELDAQSGGAFRSLGQQDRRSVALRFLDSNDQRIFALSRLVLQCYYRDERVMVSLGMDARAPFPKGFELEEDDWSILDPVRNMPKIYRSIS